MKKLTYGIIQEFEDGTTLWFEPITDERDGFALRQSDGSIQSVYSDDNYGTDIITMSEDIKIPLQ